MSVCHMHAWYPSKAEESDPLTGVTDGCQQLCGCWEPNPDILEEQQNAFNF